MNDKNSIKNEDNKKESEINGGDKEIDAVKKRTPKKKAIKKITAKRGVTKTAALSNKNNKVEEPSAADKNFIKGTLAVAKGKKTKVKDVDRSTGITEFNRTNYKSSITDMPVYNLEIQQQNIRASLRKISAEKIDIQDLEQQHQKSNPCCRGKVNLNKIDVSLLEMQYQKMKL